MRESQSSQLSRRDALKTTTAVAATALAGVAIPAVHAAGSDTIQVALVGAGGRGTGAAENALRTRSGPIKLVAVADVFQDKLDRALRSLQGEFGAQVDVPKDRQFIGFDGYKKAMDCLKPGDVVILTTPPAFRWVHFTYALQKGIHTFMEKPTTVDGPSTRRMLKLAEESVKRNLKVGVGLMCRHCAAREDLHKRIKDGQIGDITLMRAYRMHEPVGSCFSTAFNPKDPLYKGSELLYQIRRFHSFLWASGGCYSDFLIHNIDECCWMKDAWPIKAHGLGGRHYRGDNVDQNFDNYSIEYTFADGSKFLLEGRYIKGCHQEFASYAHGTKGSAVISTRSHTPAKCRIYKSQNIDHKDDLVWQCMKDEPNPYQIEWDRLILAIRNDKPHNECKRGAEASLVTAMGRMAAHTGRVITFEEMLNCEHEFAPQVDQLTMQSAAPLPASQGGRYPIPQPGVNLKREF
jgi:predicted dehydrogenase